MSLSYQQLIDLAVEQSLRGLPEGSSSDIETTAEALAPLAMLKLAIRVADNPDQRNTLRNDVSITLTNGTGTVPSSVLISRLNNSSVLDSNNPDDEYTYHPNFNDFIRDPETRLGRYNAQETVFRL